jgi:hypothetical protein
MTCMFTVSATVTGGTMTVIHIQDLTTGLGPVCTSASSCSFLEASGRSVAVLLISGDNHFAKVGSPFTFTCPGSAPQPATFSPPDEYLGSCQTTNLSGDYNMTASF